MLPDPIEEDFPPSRYEPPDVSFGLDKDDLGGDKNIWYGICYLGIMVMVRIIFTTGLMGLVHMVHNS